MKPISLIENVIQAADWTQDKVDLFRARINEIIAAVNETYYPSNSQAVKVLSGAVTIGPTPPKATSKHTFAAASSPEEIAHGLTRVPTGYLVIRCYPIGKVADASLDQWNAKTVFLQADTPGLTVTLLFF